MKYQGNLHKMHSHHDDTVAYELELGGQLIRLNDWLGKSVQIEYLQQIECIHCGRKTKKSFNQGYCYPCFSSLAQCDMCIMSPEKCHYHLGTCREPEWGLAHCMKPHIVYLSNTSGAKVGITFIHVTHNQEEAMAVADRIAIIAEGELVEVGTAKQIYEKPEK